MLHHAASAPPLPAGGAGACLIENRESAFLQVSNGRAKAELEWEPQFPSYREGLRAVLDAEMELRKEQR